MLSATDVEYNNDYFILYSSKTFNGQLIRKPEF